MRFGYLRRMDGCWIESETTTHRCSECLSIDINGQYPRFAESSDNTVPRR